MGRAGKRCLQKPRGREPEGGREGGRKGGREGGRVS